jgi:hypothetical protein
MSTEELIKEIQQLSISKRSYIVEKTIESIRKQEDKIQLTNAAEELYVEYKTDKELTIFSNIDFDDFYETR